MSNKAEKLFNKLANTLISPAQVANNGYDYTDMAKYKHQVAESGKMVENNKMIVDNKTEDKHARKPDADEGKKQAAVENLKSKWING